MPGPTSQRPVTGTPGRYRTAGMLAFEFVVIVAGVLVALAVDEWRDGRARAERERTFLESLVEDLARDSAELTGWGRFHARRVDAANVILLAAGHPLADTAAARRGEANELTPARAFGLIGLANHLEPSFATFNGMVAAGNAIVSDPDLHQAILAYYAELEDALSYNRALDVDADEFRRLLQPFGYSPSDRGWIDPTPLYSDREMLAMVRSLQNRAGAASRQADEVLPMTLELRRRVLEALRRNGGIER